MNKYERSLWIINTLSDYGDASLKELNERLRNYSLNYEGEEISPRTFARDKDYIASTFQIDIEYDPRTRKYRLVNQEDIRNNSLYRYLMSSIHVNSLSAMAIRHKDRIMLEEVPTGVESLHILLEAIDKRRTVRFDYSSYYRKGHNQTYEVIPCFVRMFERRWYLICEYLDRSQTRVLALERMRQLVIGEKQETPSPNLTPRLFYQDCFGIIRDDKQPEEIFLKVYQHQVEYVRSVPIHPSQEEVESTADYTIFRYYVRPSYDFIQQLLWHRENMEVLAPHTLREEIRSLLQKMLERYATNIS